MNFARQHLLLLDVTPIRKKYIPALLGIEKECHVCQTCRGVKKCPNALTKGHFNQLTDKDERDEDLIGLAVTYEGKPIGFAVGRKEEKPGILRIGYLAIQDSNPSWLKQITELCISELSSRGYHTLTCNIRESDWRLQELLADCSFRTEEPYVRRGFFKDTGEDAFWVIRQADLLTILRQRHRKWPFK